MHKKFGALSPSWPICVTQLVVARLVCPSPGWLSPSWSLAQLTAHQLKYISHPQLIWTYFLLHDVFAHSKIQKWFKLVRSTELIFTRSTQSLACCTNNSTSSSCLIRDRFSVQIIWDIWRQCDESKSAPYWGISEFNSVCVSSLTRTRYRRTS